jgi:8-oxo-dGTP diphosphatase
MHKKDDAGIFRVAVSAIILNNNNELLITQRSFKRDHHPGEWETMSGRLHQGEDFITALHREIKEELNIVVEPIIPISTFHFYRGSEEVEHLGVVYLCRYKSGDVKVDGFEEIDYKWINLEKASEIINDRSILESIEKTIDFLSKMENLGKFKIHSSQLVKHV